MIDEDCLNEAECRDAVLATMNEPIDWRNYLSPRELREFEKAGEMTNSYYPYAISLTGRDMRHELALRGGLRAYARRKYAGGDAIWYGDGVPFQRS